MRLAVCLLALLAGCHACDADYAIPPPSGVPARSVAAQQPGSANKTACDRLLAEEVNVLLGTGGDVQSSGDSSTCSYQASGAATLSVIYGAGGGEAMWKEVMGQPGLVLVTLPGGADGARMTVPTMFVVRKGDQFVLATAGVPTSVPAARVETVMTNVAARL